MTSEKERERAREGEREKRERVKENTKIREILKKR